jgi:peptidyl-prolyl cis-trans isomerase D
VLDSIRKNSQSWFVKALLSAIVIVFISWGVGSFSARKLQVVARVNGEVISDQEFRHAYQNVQRLFSRNSQASPPDALLRERTLDQLITARLLMQQAQRLGLVVTKEELRDSIAAIPDFQVNGRFNRDLYLRVLQANQLTPPSFEASQSEDLLVRKVQQIIASGAQVTEAQALDRFRYENEEVGLKIVKLAAVNFLPRVELADGDVQTYFEQNREHFREPERVSIRYLYFPADHFAALATPSDEEIQRFYEDNLDRYRKKDGENDAEQTRPLDEVRDEVIKALKLQMGRQLAVKQADQAHERLLDGDKLDAVASSLGLTVVDPPPFSQKEPVAGLPSSKEVRNAAFAVEAGEVGDIATLDSGYVVFVVTERKQSYIPDFDAVRQQAEQELRLKRAGEAARQQAEALLAKLKETPGDLEKLAAENKLSVEKTDPFRRLGGYISNVGNVPELKEAAFRLSPEDPVAPTVYEVNGDAVVAVLDQRLPADEGDFQAQKDTLMEQERRRLEMALVVQFVDYLKGQAKIEYGKAYTAQEL